MGIKDFTHINYPYPLQLIPHDKFELRNCKLDDVKRWLHETVRELLIDLQDGVVYFDPIWHLTPHGATKMTVQAMDREACWESNYPLNETYREAVVVEATLTPTPGNGVVVRAFSFYPIAAELYNRLVAQIRKFENATDMQRLVDERDVTAVHTTQMKIKQRTKTVEEARHDLGYAYMIEHNCTWQEAFKAAWLPDYEALNGKTFKAQQNDLKETFRVAVSRRTHKKK